MRLRLLAVLLTLFAMVAVAGCASREEPQEQQMGTLEEYENYGPWSDPYANGYGYGYDPFSPFWYSPYPYYYPYYYYPVYPGPWYVPPRPRPRPVGPIGPKGGGGGGPPIRPHPHRFVGPSFSSPSSREPMRMRTR